MSKGAKEYGVRDVNILNSEWRGCWSGERSVINEFDGRKGRVDDWR